MEMNIKITFNFLCYSRIETTITPEEYESGIKIPDFRQNFQKYKKNWKRKKCFCAYGQVSQS